MTETYLTLSEAAKVTNRSRVTLRRYLDAGRFPHAKRDEEDVNQQWLVPASDLVAAGVEIHPGALDECAPAALDISLEVRLAVAEAVAAERADALDRIGELAAALRAQADAITALLGTSSPLTFRSKD